MRYLVFLLYCSMAPGWGSLIKASQPVADDPLHFNSMMEEKRVLLTDALKILLKDDSVRAFRLYDQGDYYLFHRLNDSAIAALEQSLAISEELISHTRDSAIWAAHIQTLFTMGFACQQALRIDTSIYFLQKGLDRAISRFGEIHPLTTLFYWKLERYYIFKGNYRSARECAFRFFNQALKVFENKSIFMAHAYFSMAYQNFLLNDRVKMELYYNKAEEIFDELLPEYLKTIESKQLESMSIKKNQWTSPFPNSLAVFLPWHYVDFHARVSYNHLMMGALANARYHFNKAAACYYAVPHLQSRLYFRLHLNRANLLAVEGRLEEAVRLADSLIAYTNGDKDKYIFIDAYEAKALAYEKQGRFDEAYQCMMKCFNIYIPNNDQGIILYIRARKAELAYKSGRLDLSHDMIDNWLKEYALKGKDIQTSDFKIRTLPLLIVQRLMPLLRSKFLIQFEKLTKKRELSLLLESEKLFRVLHESTVYLHEKTFSDANRLILEAEHHPLYEKAILLNHWMDSVSTFKNEVWIPLKWSEASKNVILGKEVSNQSQRHRSITGTAEQLERIKQMIKQVNFDLIELDIEDTVQNSRKKLRLQSQMAEYYGQLELLKEKYVLELDSEGLSQMRNDYPVQSVRDKLLTKDAVLLDFFYGDSLISIHLLTPDTLITRLLLKKPDFDSTISSYLSALRQTSRQSLSLLDSLTGSVYREILNPVAAFLKTKYVVIIPDGILSFIPFEHLLQKKHPHLAISYEYSSSVYLRSERPKTSNKYVGFAPIYEDTAVFHQSRGDSILLNDLYASNRSSLGFLRFNVPEVKESAQILNGLSFTGKQIGKSLFFKHIRNAGIIHLALHALANDQNPEYSQFLLHSESHDGSNEPLYAYQIRDLDLHSELAILSACNTGAGKYQHGNGVESLAKAFKQAGCNNIVMSLWPVNDASTKEIVVGFIQNLKNGLGKADALAKSKIDYLAKAPEEMKHPYYWAGLVLIGDNEPMFGIGLRGLKGLGMLGILMGLIALMTLLFFKYRSGQ